VEPAEQTVLGIARGYQLSQALYVAARLGVADVLDPQPLAALTAGPHVLEATP
jgi:hypothetical protein